MWFQIYKIIYTPEDSEVLEKILSGRVHQKFWLNALSHNNLKQGIANMANFKERFWSKGFKSKQQKLERDIECTTLVTWLTADDFSR